MTSLSLLTIYLQWHFGIAFQELYQMGKNVSWFGYHFFSMPLLMKTLIRPIYRIHETAPPGSGLNIELFFENITVNAISRIVGFFLRLFLIICGILYQLVLAIIIPFIFFIWFVLPAIPLFFLFVGIRMVFTSL